MDFQRFRGHPVHANLRIATVNLSIHQCIGITITFHKINYNNSY